MDSKTDVHVVYRLVGYPLRQKDADLPPREIDFTGVPLFELQRIFHAGPNNRMFERRYVNSEKALRLQSFCSEAIDMTAYRWEFFGKWSDDENQ
jgi:hypothetical protein